MQSHNIKFIYQWSQEVKGTDDIIEEIFFALDCFIGIYDYLCARKNPDVSGRLQKVLIINLLIFSKDG